MPEHVEPLSIAHYWNGVFLTAVNRVGMSQTSYLVQYARPLPLPLETSSHNLLSLIYGHPLPCVYALWRQRIALVAEQEARCRLRQAHQRQS